MKLLLEGNSKLVKKLVKISKKKVQCGKIIKLQEQGSMLTCVEQVEEVAESIRKVSKKRVTAVEAIQDHTRVLAAGEISGIVSLNPSHEDELPYRSTNL